MMYIKLLALCFLSIIFGAQVEAKTHTWYYDVTYAKANVDDRKERYVVTFNHTWPMPELRVKQNDTVNLYLTNKLEDLDDTPGKVNTSLHFHGLFQQGTNQMDGPEFVTQCPIPPGETYLYNFTIKDQVGTYWYHSHSGGQYMDGMRGPFIIEENTKEDYPFDFDEEVTLSLGEWYWDFTNDLMPSFLSRFNPTGAEPIPNSILFNNSMNVTWDVEPDKTYFVRIVNVGGFVSHYLYMDDHEFEIVEVDGVYVKPNKTDLLYITVAQRYGVLIKTKKNPTRNYAFMNAFDLTMLDKPIASLSENSTNVLHYDSSKPKPKQYFIDSFDDRFDDFYLEPLEKIELYDDPDKVITIDVIMDNLDNGVNYAFFNNITYTKPKVPTLATVLSSGKYSTNELVYGTNTHSIVLQKDETVDLVLNNQDTGTHPFHLHGHVFQMIERYPSVDDDDDPVAFNKSDHAEWPRYPARRDTAYLNPQSYAIFRFKADNPGVWFFHCHIEWHLEQGLAIVLVEDPETIQKTKTQQLSDSFKNACKKAGVPFEGNAAANSNDYLDLTGQNIQVKNLPAGFTARGIVALVFSCISAFLGMAAIAFYGLEDIKDVETRVAMDLNVEEELLQEDDSESISASASLNQKGSVTHTRSVET